METIELFLKLQQKEPFLNGGEFGMDQEDCEIYWQYKRDVDDEEDLGDFLSDAKEVISELLEEFDFEVTDEYIESSYASFHITPKKKINRPFERKRPQ
jgi:hypothetical protein